MKLFLGLLFLFGSLFASVDINNASEEELVTLKGIASITAKEIIKYRTDNCFENISDLKNVKGIGLKTVEKNKDNLTIGECK